MPQLDNPQPPHGLIGLEPLPFQEQWQTEIWLLLLLSFALALGVYIWRRQRAFAKRKIEPRRSPWQELADSLKDLREPEADGLPYFYLELSRVLRQAIELRYGFPASSQTLPELEKSFSLVPHVAEDQRLAYVDFLRLADRVKFAGQSLDRDTHRRWLEQVRGWVSEGGAGG